MSLKAFHIVFIALSVLTAAGFGIWLIGQYTAEGRIILLISAIISFIVASGLIVYGLMFLRKLKHVSFL